MPKTLPTGTFTFSALTRSTAASVSERLKGAADEAFLDALPRIVDQLIAEPGK